MKLTSMKAISFATVALLTASTCATVVNADTTGATLNSKGTVTYQPSTNTTKPQDPQNPGTEVTPLDPDGNPEDEGTAGPLSLDHASSFNFGTQNVTSSDMTYTASAQDIQEDSNVRTNYAQVTDNRGTLGGWSLTVTPTEFTAEGVASGTAGSILKGAQITLGDAEISTNSEAPADVVNSATLTPNAASGTILGASSGKGAGTNMVAFGHADGSTADTAVTLFVPGSSTKLATTYTATLTWTLSDTPAG